MIKNLTPSLAALLMVFFITPETGLGADTRRLADEPKSTSDIALPPAGESEYIYIADAEGGAVYRKQVAGNRYGAISLGEGGFECIFKNSTYTRPQSIAYSKGKLIVCDFTTKVVFEIDAQGPETQQPVVLIKPPLIKPSRVAISPNGDILVSDDRLDGIVWYERSSNQYSILPYSFDDPTRLVFSNGNLLVLETEESEIYTHRLYNSTSDTGQYMGSSVVLLPRKYRDLISQTKSRSNPAGHSKITDFAAWDNVIYLINEVDNKKEVLSLSNSDKALPVLFDGSDKLIPSCLQTNGRELYIADNKNRAVWKLKRSIPVDISFKSGLKQSTGSIVDFYNYLYSSGMLPRRKATLTSSVPLQQLLFDEKILPWTLNEKGYADIKRNMERLVCALNPTLCDDAKQRTRNLLETLFTEDKEVTLPDVHIQTLLGTSSVQLANKTVARHLEERIPSPADRERFNESVLSVLNPSLFRTIEGELNRRNFIVATPPLNSLEPRTILYTDRGRDRISRENIVLYKCENLPPSTSKQALKLPSLLRGIEVVAHLPRLSASTTTPQPSLPPDIEKLEVSFEEPSIETIDYDLLENGLKDNTLRTCLNQKAGTGIYFVLEALKVQKAKYKLTQTNGFDVIFTADDLRKFGIDGEPDPEGKWSFIVNHPLYVGYRAGNLNQNFINNPSTLKESLSATSVKPNSRLDLLNRSTGTLTLPYNYWRMTALVSAIDYEDKNSQLWQLNTRDNRVLIDSYGSNAAKGASALIPDNTNKGASPEDLIKIKADRKKLKDAVKSLTEQEIIDAEIDLSDTRIGIMESADSDWNHPDLGTLYSFEEAEDIFLRKLTKTPTEMKKWIKVYERKDHGTQIAGIIAASPESEAPGILPSQELLLIDAAKFNKWPDYVNKAKTSVSGLVVFNISQEVDAERNMTSFERIVDESQDRLFVIAAGNSLQRGTGRDLKDEKNNLVSLSKGRSNVIVVAATDLTGTLLQSSNRGKQYVQLAAPGGQIETDPNNEVVQKGFFSQSQNNSYAVTSGTSVAAPLVSAAAHLLFVKGLENASKVKARLIYTSDWKPEYEGKVWGGALNIKTAITRHDKDIFIAGSMTKWQVFSINNSEENIRITGSGCFYSPDEPTCRSAVGLTIPIKNILRLTNTGNGKFRIIYIEKGAQQDSAKLKIILNASLIDKDLSITCSPPKPGVPNTEIPAECNQKIVKLNNIVDYVAGIGLKRITANTTITF